MDRRNVEEKGRGRKKRREEKQFIPLGKLLQNHLTVMNKEVIIFSGKAR